MQITLNLHQVKAVQCGPPRLLKVTDSRSVWTRDLFIKGDGHTVLQITLFAEEADGPQAITVPGEQRSLPAPAPIASVPFTEEAPVCQHN